MFSVAASSVNLLRGSRPRPRRLDNNRFTDDNNTKKQKLLLLSSCNYSNNVRRRRSRCVVSSSASGGGSEWRPPSSPAVHDVAPGAPDEPRVAYTHTSAHAHVPHTVTVTVSRPASRHITVAPQLLPAPHHAYTELEVRGERGRGLGGRGKKEEHPPGSALDIYFVSCIIWRAVSYS